MIQSGTKLRTRVPSPVRVADRGLSAILELSENSDDGTLLPSLAPSTLSQVTLLAKSFTRRSGRRAQDLSGSTLGPHPRTPDETPAKLSPEITVSSLTRRTPTSLTGVKPQLRSAQLSFAFMPLAEGRDPSTSVPVTGSPPHPHNSTNGLPHGRQSSPVPATVSSLSCLSHSLPQGTRITPSTSPSLPTHCPHLRHSLAPRHPTCSSSRPSRLRPYLFQPQDHPRPEPHQDQGHLTPAQALSTQACPFNRRTELRSPATRPKPCISSSPGASLHLSVFQTRSGPKAPA